MLYFCWTHQAFIRSMPDAFKADCVELSKLCGETSCPYYNGKGDPNG